MVSFLKTPESELLNLKKSELDPNQTLTMSNFSHTQFNKGDQVEVLKRENGPKTSTYYPAIVLKPSKTHVFVEYQTLMINESTDPKRITESVGLGFVRPKPPRGTIEYFKVDDNVDVYCDNGWHKGIVRDILENSKYVVGFVGQCGDGIVTEQCNLRLHREWDDGSWIPPLLGQGMQVVFEGNGRNTKPIFSKGMKVEVKSDEAGFQGSWFPATIVKMMENDKFLVQYQTLVTDDETDFLIEGASVQDIRPSPPQIQRAYPFAMSEIVDAWYNDGWWVGRIIKVQDEFKYTVHFKTAEKLEFEHCQLRPHQEWINGNWITVPKNWKF